jgi:hypothetical protein
VIPMMRPAFAGVATSASAAARAVSLSFISAFYATSDSWWQPNAGRRGESERASLGKSVMQSIGRTRQDAAATVRGKPGRRGGGRVKLGTASKTARDFWEYLRAKATLAAPECRDTSQKVHDRACQRSLARWSRRLTGSTLGGRSFRSHATAGYAPTAVITKRPMRGLSRVDCRPSPRGSEATRLRRFRPFAGRAAFDIKPPLGYVGAATERRLGRGCWSARSTRSTRLACHVEQKWRTCWSSPGRSRGHWLMRSYTASSLLLPAAGTPGIVLKTPPV